MNEVVKEEKGIKETKEALVGVFELVLLLSERFKDGIGVDDAMFIFSKLTGDSEFKAKMEASFKGIKELPAEIKDIDLNEVMELVAVPIAYVPKFIGVFKKPAVA